MASFGKAAEILFLSSVSIVLSAMVTGEPSGLWSGVKVSLPNHWRASLAQGMVLVAAKARRDWRCSVILFEFLSGMGVGGC